MYTYKMRKELADAIAEMVADEIPKLTSEQERRMLTTADLDELRKDLDASDPQPVDVFNPYFAGLVSGLVYGGFISWLAFGGK